MPVEQKSYDRWRSRNVARHGRCGGGSGGSGLVGIVRDMTLHQQTVLACDPLHRLRMNFIHGRNALAGELALSQSAVDQVVVRIL